ncbi:MBL fold metallo-hydrolase [Jiella marina]|uniref:MBL fold metallo-hydrolase n=1 Tax=Jiella sp. LLJ827 TaxID=2917712 RepID=UPI00210141ED|nr:MBL fold metallo-hydrolase [Jiella sp. LLJ827]MCQ0989335.1 MBL fold metallo-hydrolase [Jiella sp. LLJ827]
MRSAGPAVLLAMLTILALAGCLATRGSDDPESGAFPPALRPLALPLHHLAIATGNYLNTDQRLDRRLFDGKARVGRAKSDLRLTWYGHATARIEIAGLSILTDPVLDTPVDLASPLPHAFHKPLLSESSLPRIDAVLISHGDYDHLHMPSLRAIARRFPQATIILPEGLGHYGRDAGFTRVGPLKLGQNAMLGSLTVTALPAIHATKRNLLGIPDGKAFSWEIRSRDRRVLFIGDTGYGSVFAEIGRQRGPYDLVLVPIGASEPDYLVREEHASPEEAVRIAEDLRARHAIGIHWGSFALAPETRSGPARRFVAAGRDRIEALVLPLGRQTAID